MRLRRWPFYLKVEGQFVSCTLREPDSPNGACVIFLHGWGGEREIVGWLLDHLCSRGYHVFNFTQRGYFDSGGGRELSKWLPDASEMVDYVARAQLEPWVCGLSTGGSLAITLAAGKSEVKGCVALSPFASFRKLFDDVPEHRKSLERIFGDLYSGIDSLDAERAVGRIAPRPLLLVHGDSDEVIPPKHSETLFRAAGDPRQLKVVKGANHTFSNVAREEVCEIVSNWIAENRRSARTDSFR
ncbi:MAG: alpha/beta fold hydrolase [Candidatus Brockarchaeota archaeon]|nr:alpha/beta fold hydrolase [Candidatus Brockarchaeota archaeon]